MGIVQVDSRGKLAELLGKYGVDVSLLGNGGSKPLDSLWGEIQAGTTLELDDEDGPLLRCIHVSCVIIACFVAGRQLRLWEVGYARLGFEDNALFRPVVRQDIGFVASVAGKVKKGETPEEALIRELKEELRIEGPLNFTSNDSSVIEVINESPSYPGKLFRTKYVFHCFHTLLDRMQFREYYIEHKEGKDLTLWVWRELGFGAPTGYLTPIK